MDLQFKYHKKILKLRSDVLGQILPILGGQWAQAGVAQLFSRIVSNGYKVLYLSARAIGQSHMTKGYLRSVRQEGKTLPDGPLLLSPTSLISALHREVIEKKPEEFKKSALSDVKTLFNGNENPYFAGFGNKINDVWAYRAVGIPASRIFSINHLGEVRWDFSFGFHSNYSALAIDLVDHFFPPLRRFDYGAEQRPAFTSPDAFSQFTFWRPVDVVIDMERFQAKHDKKAETKK